MKRKIEDRGFMSPWMIVIIVAILILAGLAVIVAGTDATGDDVNPLTKKVYADVEFDIEPQWLGFNSFDVSTEQERLNLGAITLYPPTEKDGKVVITLKVAGNVTDKKVVNFVRTTYTDGQGDIADYEIDLDSDSVKLGPFEIQGQKGGSVPITIKGKTVMEGTVYERTSYEGEVTI